VSAAGSGRVAEDGDGDGDDDGDGDGDVDGAREGSPASARGADGVDHLSATGGRDVGALDLLASTGVAS